jgi:hypothetical protein
LHINTYIESVLSEAASRYGIDFDGVGLREQDTDDEGTYVRHLMHQNTYMNAYHAFLCCMKKLFKINRVDGLTV